MSSEEAEKESTNSNSDDETHVTGSMVESSRIKKLKKFDFITEDGRHIHLTEEEINRQKKLEEDAKAKATKQEEEVRKAELVDLLGPEVVNNYYNDKLQYDRYCDKMLNRRAESRITNCDVLTKKGPITLKVYREDGTSEVIPNFKDSDLQLGEWREVVKSCPNRTGKGWKTIYGQIQIRMDYLYTTKAELGINLDIPLSEQDHLDKLNDLANKNRKHADDIHDYFKANKRLKSSVQYEDHLPGTVLNEHVLEIFFRRHQGPRLDDHARTFSSLLLAEVDKRNLNPLKQMRTIKQLRHGTETEEGLCKELQFSLIDNSKLSVILKDQQWWNNINEVGVNTNVLKTNFLIDPVESPGHGPTGFFGKNWLSVYGLTCSTDRVNPGFKTLVNNEEHNKCGTTLVNDKNGNGPSVESNMKENGLDNLKDDSIKDNNEKNKMGLTNKDISRGNKILSNKYVVNNNSKHQDEHVAIMTDEELNEEPKQDSLMNRKEKCEISQSSSVGNEGDRLRKKRKACNEGIFEGNIDELIFNQGKSSGEKSEDKKKINRMSVTKAFEVARKTRVKGIGENKKGVLDVYKEYHDVDSMNNGIFHFRSSKEDGGDSISCNVNIEQVKEIKEMIVVSWARAEEEEKKNKRSRKGETKGGAADQGDIANLGHASLFLQRGGWRQEIYRGKGVMEKKNQEYVFKEAWKKEVRSARPYCRFRDRLKNVKASLRVWSKDRFGGQKEKVENLRNEAMGWEIEAEKRVLNDSERTSCEKVKQVVGNVVGEVQNAFIKGRYILDEVLIAKEIMDYLKIKKGKSLIFKVDFEKATSSVSVLVNGSLSEEFGLEMDIRQGDPLSPFLFILAAEDLNVIVTEAVENGIFRGVVVGANNVTVSGLKVNYNKSKIYGIGVNEGDMTDMARWMGCGIGEVPFTYWGLPIGENIGRVNAWGPVVEKFKNRGRWGEDVWSDIMRIDEEIDGVVIEFTSFFGMLGDGRDIWFWVDRWVDHQRLCDRFPRDIRGRVSREFEELVGVVQDIIVHSNCKDKWRWMLVDDGEFTVKELARLVEDKILHTDSGGQETI
ncbi:hypothetical protein Tco_0009640 [Tanacetum coccineum]